MMSEEEGHHDPDVTTNVASSNGGEPLKEEDQSTASRTVVIVLMGLPAAGKSSLARALVNQWNHHHEQPDSAIHLEYDQIQENVLQKDDVETTSDNVSTSNEEDDRILQAWRQSRSQARRDLQEFLLQTKDATASNRLIVVDDNSFLRSMRKQVYQTCQNSLLKPHVILFGIVWVDAPVDVCLARNPHRRRPVPNQVIQSMQERLEAPSDDDCNHCWERPVLQLDGTQSLETLVTSAWTFLQERVLRCLEPVQPPVDPAVQQARKRFEQAQTAASVLHQVDQVLRTCVQTVATRHKQWARVANEVRKQVYAQYKQKEHQHDETTVVVQAFWTTLQERLQEQPDCLFSDEEWAQLTLKV